MSQLIEISQDVLLRYTLYHINWVFLLDGYPGDDVTPSDVKYRCAL